MKPELILKSDVLDIVFENKNKGYGAYELRKYYNNRLLRSIGITLIVAVVFALLQSWKVPHKHVTVSLVPADAILRSIEIPKDEQKKPEPKYHPPTDKAQVQLTDHIKTVQQTVTPLATVEDLDKSIISNITKTGVDVEPGVTIAPPSQGKVESKTDETVVTAEPAILEKSEIMPEFPGGHDAFIKFMQRNINSPADLEEGQKMMVMARFVVDTEGNIVNIDISQRGRRDLDAEVLRVIKKMPKWKPGIQNGRKVAVYFNLPVTFVSNE